MQVLNMAGSATILANESTVWINGSLEPRLRCISVETSLGPVPGKALLMLGSIVDTEIAPRTLKAYEDYERWKFGSRVMVKSDGDLLFLGTMLYRHDHCSSDAPMWVALDDKWILSRLPIRGAFVYDPAETSGNPIKFLSRFQPFFNPGGMWNCVGYNTGSGVRPLFYPYAEARPTLLNQSFDSLVAGELTAWTPRRALQYLQYAATTDVPPGWTSDRHWRQLSRSNRVNWPAHSIDHADGTKGKGGLDPLDAKLQATNCTNKNVLETICQLLKYAGTHDFGMEVGGASRESTVTYYPRDGSGEGCNIIVRRGGRVAESNIAIDFDMHEDATGVSESVLMEGSPVKCELRVTYRPDDAGNPEADPPTNSTNTLDPAWSDEDEQYFKTVIWGGPDPGESGDPAGAYAKVPAAPGEEPTVDCDGTGGNPLCYSLTADAVALARQLYPNVFMEFKLNTAILDADPLYSPFNGPTQEFADRDQYPVVKESRPTYQEQLTKLFLGDTLQARYPVRIEVDTCTVGLDPPSAAAWVDAPFLNGFLSSPTTIRIQGLAENAEGQPFCIYNGSLYKSGSSSTPWLVTRKGVRINLAIPLDHRVEGYAEISNTQSPMDSSLNEEFGGRLMLAQLNPSFTNEYARNSYPKPDSATAVNASLEDSTPDAIAAAERMLSLNKLPEKRSNWTFPGIRLDYTPGKWVRKIKVVGGTSADIDYDIKGILPSCVYDFLRQETRLGGITHFEPAPPPIPDRKAPQVAATEPPKDTRAADKAKESATAQGNPGPKGDLGPVGEQKSPGIYWGKGKGPSAEASYGGGMGEGPGGGMSNL